jgi:hypothetical protein
MRAAPVSLLLVEESELVFGVLVTAQRKTRRDYEFVPRSLPKARMYPSGSWTRNSRSPYP